MQFHTQTRKTGSLASNSNSLQIKHGALRYFCNPENLELPYPYALGVWKERIRQYIKATN